MTRTRKTLVSAMVRLWYDILHSGMSRSILSQISLALTWLALKKDSQAGRQDSQGESRHLPCATRTQKKKKHINHRKITGEEKRKSDSRVELGFVPITLGDNNQARGGFIGVMTLSAGWSQCYGQMLKITLSGKWLVSRLAYLSCYHFKCACFMHTHKHSRWPHETDW